MSLSVDVFVEVGVRALSSIVLSPFAAYRHRWAYRNLSNNQKEK